jgi:hypothetical protein
MLEEELKKATADIAEAIKGIGYELTGSCLFSFDFEGKLVIALSIKPVEKE